MMRAIEYCIDDSSRFFVRYHSPTRDYSDMRTEFFNDAKRISEEHGPVYVAFSGGADSQIIARCFVDQQLPAEFVFLHVVGCNDVELQQVRKCENFFKIKVTVFELDIESKREEWTRLAVTEKNAAMHQYQFAWLSEQLPESWPLITQGSVEPAIVGTSSDDVGIYHNYFEEMECRFRMIGLTRPVIDFPFSPEAVAAYYTDDGMKTFCQTFMYYLGDGCSRTQHYNVYAKAMVKGRYFPDIIWFPKLSGYEEHPDWIVTDYNNATKVSVPYHDVRSFLVNERNTSRDYKDWHYRYGSSSQTESVS